jgi:hypothetical protein
MIMNAITINTKQFSFPSTWQELSSAQILHIAPYLLGTNDSVVYRKAAVLFTFLPFITKYWRLHPWVVYVLQRFPSAGWRTTYPVFNEAQKWDLLQTVNFLFQDISGTAILKSFTHHGERYYLPGDNFTRESIIAFAFADEYFNSYVEYGDSRFIDLLIGCIARQAGSTLYPALQFAEGDKREHFSTARTENRAKAFKDLPDKIKTTILLYFMGSKKYIHTHYEIMFRKKKEEVKEEVSSEPQQRIKTFGKKKIPKPNFNWIGIIYELSETGVFGNFDQVKNMFVHTCCYYLAKKRYEQEEQTA